MIAGTMTIAVRTDGILQWILPDHLGSTSTTATPRQARGASRRGRHAQQRYPVHGVRRNTVNPGHYTDEVPAIAQHPVKGTGQLAQAELGLDYYVARWYDPVLGHFTQADTLVPEPGKASAFDRYAHGLNNPVKYNDPSGHDVGCAGRDASNCSSWNHAKGRNPGYRTKPSSVMT